jgi:galactose mutarotase-like enzyme
MVTLENDNYLACFVSKGAELVSFKNKKTNQEYIWEGNPDFWGKHSPILFPIVGTLKNASYIHNEIMYSLPRHGFARDMEFEIVSKNENSVTFSLVSTTETLAKYPFHFELQLSYTLQNNKLDFSYSVINNNAVEMPFSLGAHPAFALHGHFLDYALEFEHQETLNCFVLENDLLSDVTYPIELNQKLMPLDYSKFEKDALIFKKLKSKTITLLANKAPVLKVSFSDFPNLGIWTKINAPFICIEPWLGYSDKFNSNCILSEKDGIHIAKTNSINNFTFTIEILS